MKRSIYIFLIIVIASFVGVTKAQHKIAVEFWVQANGYGVAQIYNDTLTEGQVYTIKSETLPTGYSAATTLYDALAGSEFYFQSGSLNHNIKLQFVISNIDLSAGSYGMTNGANLFFNVNFLVYDSTGALEPEPFNLNPSTYAVVKINKSTMFNAFLSASGINLSDALKFAYQEVTGSDTSFVSSGITTYDSTSSVTAYISHFSNVVGTKSTAVTAVKEQPASNMPTQFVLKQNYPNPFNPTTNIVYELPKTAFVHLNVYNILGEKIATLVNSVVGAGVHSVTFNPGNISSGLYIYQLKTDGITLSRKMLLMK